MHPQADQFLFQQTDKGSYVALVGFQVANCGYLPEDGMFEVSAVGTHNDQPKRVFLEVTREQFEALGLIDISKLSRNGPHLFNGPEIVRLKPVAGRIRYYKREQMAVVQVRRVGEYDVDDGAVLAATFDPPLNNHRLYTSSQDVQMFGSV